MTKLPPGSDSRLCAIVKASFTCLLLIFSSSQLFAQFPDGCNLGCTSNDVDNIIAFLGDNDTIPLDIDCTPGETVDNVIIWIKVTFNSNSSREPIRWDGDVILTSPEGDADTTVFNGCINDGTTSGTNEVYIAADTIGWICGDELLIKNFISGWSQPGGGQDCNDCPNNPKCIELSEIFVQAPLVANIIVDIECQTGNIYESMTVSDATIGGLDPYSFSWTFGPDASPNTANSDGPHNVTFSSQGTKTVSLTVTDSDGDVSSISIDTLEVGFCCEAEITCPTDVMLQCAGDLPDIPSSFEDDISENDEADFKAIDGMSDISNSCRDIIVVANDSDNGNTGCMDDTLIVTRTYFIYDDLDGNGQLSPLEIERGDTCRQLFLIVDDIAPIFNFTPGHVTVECDAIPDAGVATASDNCSVTVDFVGETREDGNCPNEYTLIRTWQAMDDCSNVTATTQWVNVQDSQAPSMDNDASDLTVECDGNGNAAALNTWLGNNGGASATDVCGSVSWVHDYTGHSDDCGATGGATVTFTATDDCGNATTTTGIFTIEDITPPAITTQAADLTVECDGNGNVSDLNTWLSNNGGAAGSDICGDAHWSHDFSVLGDECSLTGSAMVTFTLTDDCGNASTTTGVFTIQDITSPSITTDASDLTVECDGDGNTEDLNQWLNNNGGASASDICSGVEWSHDYTSLSDDCGSTGHAMVVFTATDDCGNSTTSTAVFTIRDLTPPSMDVDASDLTVECDGDGNTAALNTWLSSNGGANASDICGDVDWSHDYSSLSDDCSATGGALVTFTATDDCGNSTTTTASFTIQDITPPSMDVDASDLTVECDGSGNTAALNTWLGNNGGASATDMCGSVSWAHDYTGHSDDCGATGGATVTFTATDDCGNATTTTGVFTIEDNTPPAITTQADDLTVECDGNGNVSDLNTWLSNNGGAAGSDICGDAHWSHDFFTLADECGLTGSAMVTFTLTDDCGNASTTTGVFTIQDITPPSITTDASDLTVECDGDGNTEDLNQWLNNNGGASASDICSGVEWSHDYTSLSDDCGSTGHAMVVFTATDDCGNSTTSTAVFTIRDLTPPSMDVDASDLTVECDGDGNTAALNTWLSSNGGANASDICGDVDWSHDYSSLSDDCSATGGALVTFTATDDCGNSTTTTASFTIQDITPPSMDVEASDLTVECDGSGNTAALNTWLGNNGGASATDVCGSVSWAHDYTGHSDDCGATGGATVTFTATDDCGNATSTTGVFTIEDNTPPVITTQADDLTVECDGNGNVNDLNTWLSNNGGAAGNDICGDAHWSHDFSVLADECGLTGSAMVTFTLTDDCGNTSSSEATFNIIDSSSPQFSFIPSNITVECDQLPSVGQALASDICSGMASVEYAGELITSGSCPNAYTITRKWIATDDCNNSSTATQIITVEDITEPVIDCPSKLILECGDDLNFQSQIQDWLQSAEATDNCGTATISNNYDGVSIPALSCDRSDGLTVIFTAIDQCGNQSNCERTIYVDDTTPPVLTVSEPIVYLECDEVASNSNEGFSATDECSDVALSSVIHEGFCLTAPKNVSSGSANAYSPTNWFRIPVSGLNDDILNASDVESINLLFDVTTSNGGNGGKGQVEFWLVNPCNETVRLTGPYCVNNSNDPNDLGCEQQGLFNPLFSLHDPCRPRWVNADIMDNEGGQQIFAPYAGIEGSVELGNIDATAFSSVEDFTCSDINGDWYIFGVKDNSENASIQFMSVCLNTCPEAYTKEITAIDACNQSSTAVQYLVRQEECTNCSNRLYVDQNATGLNDGTSWADAYVDLQSALADALPGDSIWIARGEYYPTTGTDRSISFGLTSGVHLVGGFDGTESELSQRNINNNETILSGAIGSGDAEDNSYHVVVAPDCGHGSSITQITIHHGYANGTSGMESRGGGVLNLGGLDLRNVIIEFCYASEGGSSLCNTGSEAVMHIWNSDLSTDGNGLNVLNTDSAELHVMGQVDLDDD